MADFLDQILAMKGRPVPAIEAPDDWKGEVRIRKVKRVHATEGTSRCAGSSRSVAQPTRSAPRSRPA
jgi:hypothetical protein